MAVDVLVLDHALPIGLRVRLARIALGLRQCDVADLAGVPPHAVSNVERGNYTCPAWRRAILELLEVGDSHDLEAAR